MSHPALRRATVVADTDPQQQGRVQVQFPGDDTPLWAPVMGLTPGTGATVLVGFEEDDPAFPVVLGVLPAASGALRLRGGVTLRSDDRGLELRIATGSSVLVTAEGIRVTAPLVRLDTTRVQAGGLVQTGTLVADHVVATTYTPGVGNER